MAADKELGKEKRAAETHIRANEPLIDLRSPSVSVRAGRPRNGGSLKVCHVGAVRTPLVQSVSSLIQ